MILRTLEMECSNNKQNLYLNQGKAQEQSIYIYVANGH